MLGCGNSVLSEELYPDGFHIYSSMMIQPMAHKSMQWIEMDIRPL